MKKKSLSSTLLAVNSLSLVAISASLIIGSVALVGCSKTEDSSKDSTASTNVEEVQKVVSLEEVSTKLTQSENLKGEGQELQKVNLKDFPIEQLTKLGDKVEEGLILMDPISFRLNEVFIIKTTDTNAVKTALQEMVDTDLKYKQFADGYGSEDNAMIAANMKIDAIGDYVYLLAVKNVDAVETELKELLK